MNFEELYSLLQTPDTEVIHNTTKILTQAYNEPCMIFSILDVLSNSRNPFVRHECAIGLKQMLNLHWLKYIEAGSGDQIKNNILSAFVKEEIIAIKHSIIFAMEPICRCREVPWPDLDNLAIALIGSNVPQELEIGLSLFEIIIQYLDESFVISNMELICQRIETAMNQTQSIDLLITAIDFLVSLIPMLDPPIPTKLDELYGKLYDIFQIALIQEWNVVYKIAEAICKTICIPPRIDPKMQIKYLIDLANNENIQSNLLFHVFNPIETFVSYEDNLFIIEQYNEELTNTILKCTLLSFEDDCYDQQSDSQFIFGVFETIAIHSDLDGDKTINMIEGLMRNNSLNASYTSLLMLQFFIDEIPEIVADILEYSIEFILKQYGNKHHCIKEEAMVCIHHIIRVVNGGLSEYAQTLLDYCLDAISSEHETLVKLGLISLTELLTTLEIPDESISCIFQKLNSFFTSSV